MENGPFTLPRVNMLVQDDKTENLANIKIHLRPPHYSVHSTVCEITFGHQTISKSITPGVSP